MIKSIRNYLYLILTLFVSAFLALFIFTSSTFAQSPAPEAGSAPSTTLDSLTFPIDDLGGCSDAAGCFRYCGDPVNHTKCISFAKENGFYRDYPVLSADSEFWDKTQEGLGCNSIESCRTVCEDSASFDKCDQFAKEEALSGGIIDPNQQVYLDKAKEKLGCDSAESCRTVCDDPANNQKCSDFAAEVGLLGGTTTEGPDGCNTAETCQSYC